MRYIRNIRFDYYQMLEVGIDKDGKKIDGSTKKFNFERIVHRIDSDNLIHKTIELNGIKVRFEDIKYNDKSGLWILRIMRERENNIPLKLKEIMQQKLLNWQMMNTLEKIFPCFTIAKVE